tara:strand:- start:4980 stop:5747 length:768 start_codon:yes stop_codon:yes gene_type:complete
MISSHVDQDKLSVHTAISHHVVKEQDGAFYEEIRWTDLTVNGEPVDLSAHKDHRQYLSLDPNYTWPQTDLSVPRELHAPILDLLTFYADLLPSIHQNKLIKAGDQLYQEGVGDTKTGSWADGKIVLIGEDALDFDLRLLQVEPESATLLVKHVSPKKRYIQTPADWMKESVTPDVENNWAQVVKVPGETPIFVARVGHETFDVTIKVDDKGRILTVLMDNPVRIRQKICSDSELSKCFVDQRFTNSRFISIEPVN